MGDLRERIEALALLEEARAEAANAKQAIDNLLSRVTVEAIAPIVLREIKRGTDGIITPDHTDIASAAAAVVAWIKGED